MSGWASDRCSTLRSAKRPPTGSLAWCTAKEVPSRTPPQSDGRRLRGLKSRCADPLAKRLCSGRRSLLPLAALRPVPVCLRHDQFVVEEPVPPLDHVHRLLEEQPHDVPHHLVGHSVGVKGPGIQVRVGVHIVHRVELSVLVEADLRGELFIRETLAMPRMILLRGARWYILISPGVTIWYSWVTGFHQQGMTSRQMWNILKQAT